MNRDEEYMNYCLALAKKGIGNVAPNPMVGCVIVYENKIIGEGYHHKYGESHAEVNAINSVRNKDELKESTLYVNLEPCAHFGKTPPCSNLIIESKIPKVVIGCTDIYVEVAGKGIQKMREAGIEVIVGVLEKESLDLNKRFFTFHNKKRPYIILKWAETKDGFIDINRNVIANHEERSGKQSHQKESCFNSSNLRQTQDDKSRTNDNWITTQQSKKLVHQLRSEEQEIMVGTNTALNDNPQLNVREIAGKNPLRIVLDLNLRLPKDLNVFDQSVLTLVINYLKQDKKNNLELVRIEKEKDVISQVFEILYQKEIQSVIVEGGAQLFNTFITKNLWDEARVFIGEKYFKNGLKAPNIHRKPSTIEQIETDVLNTYFND
ncbi:MAG: riboflavin biosynthesis protein RibD [Bacteroidetes bacterium RIFCSPLOWO2_12_FULL_31_6]|nr:MAG: riboflavin biosynthesis protein RibD [Bacteroidetes bacterium RIFCSPLOWO2_12_FULL_31_6]